MGQLKHKFCRKCWYDLRQLDRKACPECGQAFESGNPHTYHTITRTTWRARLWAIATLFVSLSVLSFYYFSGYMELGIGLHYFQGFKPGADNSRAFYWMDRAAEKGQDLPSHEIGRSFENGRTVPQDHEAAMRWYMRAAEDGDSHAMYHIANMHFAGKGVPKDEQKTFEWTINAANAGNTRAMLATALLYESGYGTTRDISKALRWFEIAARQGNIDAMMKLALVLHRDDDGYANDYNAAFKWCKAAAENGNTTSMKLLATFFHKGIGVPVDEEKMRYWIGQAAKAGDEKAISAADQLEARNDLLKE